MSLRMVVECDIDPVATSSGRASKATFTLLLGAPDAWVGRHAATPSEPSTRETVAFGSQAMVARETSGEPTMPVDSGALLVQCQLALGLTQEELADLLGKNRRTVQRWQDRGFEPSADQIETLADALRTVRPDLAEQVLELGKAALGATPPARPATAEVIDAILRAAADAGGTSPEAIRPALTAALLKAEEAGVEVSAIVAGLKSST
jgi:transcriptional regulator with XRE-family HTH domain